MEDDLNFFQMEDDLNYFSNGRQPIFFQMEDDHNFIKWKTSQFFQLDEVAILIFLLGKHGLASHSLT